ncbi:protein pellino [Galendromus occidentalis]|uniref:Protein pellino n=1 Tax=Galendromus occidentalis TaxID=34638 RepID=A0AAJ6QNJ8_9ACAR|nr:protein pellino [Galendromus occidentalis]
MSPKPSKSKLAMGDCCSEAADSRLGPISNDDLLTNLHLSEVIHSHRQQCNSLASKYGELIVLGYNGSLHENEKGRRRSKYILSRRALANGIRKSRHVSVADPAASAAVLDQNQHSIAYTLSRHQSIIVLYEKDPHTDMFQIGRSKESQIDFVVMDTIAEEQKNGEFRSGISRYACRLLIDRDGEEHAARIFAAGFDASSNIFLGENASAWQGAGGTIDGLTTNGILLMHPMGTFCKDASAGIWREVSVDGGVYGLRESRAARRAGPRIEDETNELKDGSLIDLCGATLLFRSVEGLSNSPTKSELLEKVAKLNAGRPQCPVGLNTLVVPSRSTLSHKDREKQPYVYLKCGHVQGLHSWGSQNSNEKKCPMCLKCGPVVKLVMGIEPAFYVDRGHPNYAFNPCGHMASEKTVKYWASVPTPHGTNGLNAICPFCAAQLTDTPGYVRLIFQDNID